MRIEGTWYISDNNAFLIDTKRPTVLYSKHEIDIHPHVQRSERQVITTLGKYYVYRYVFKFCKSDTFDDNDCLCFAEALATEKQRHTDPTCVFRVKGTNAQFGLDDIKNIKQARLNPQNDAANPSVGDAYAIVHVKEQYDDQAPYHIAYVIAKDGDTNITLEADAGNPTLKEPIFDMYSVSSPIRRFHTTYTPIYSPANTIVLQKRPAMGGSRKAH